MPIKNLTLGAVLVVGTALAQNHYNTHKVQKGETLEKIAKVAHTSKKALMAENHLKSDLIKVGQTLELPSIAKPILASSGYAPYTLRNADNDWKVANMFHMAPAAVRKLNPHVNWKRAVPGTKIRIPLKNAYTYKLASIPVINSRYAKVIKSNAIIRTAPGSNARRIGMVDAGRHVKVLDRDTHWYKVKFEYGTVGWVRGDLLKAESIPPIYAAREVKAKSRVALKSSVKPKATLAVHRTGRSSRSGGNRLAINLPTGKGDLLEYASSFKGTPYRYGQASRSGTDCSGFALQVLRHEGVKMPRTAAQQSRKGKAVNRDGLQKGDLVFFHTSRGSRISHVGIYMGNGKFIHASSGGGKVQVNSLNESYYKKRFATARRVVKTKKPATKADKMAASQEADKNAMKDAEKSITTPVKDPEPKADKS